MRRDLERLSARTFDVLVVGGGVYGLIVACDAAQRGLSVALIERNDFGSGSSFNHHRTIHGGLRYLQSLDLARARESIRERRTFAHIAPGAIRRVPFVLPLQASLTRGKTALRTGFALDRLLARDRNLGVPASLALPSGEVLGRRAAIDRFPTLKDVPMTGAAVWHDYVTTDADRLTFGWALNAATSGAELANYVEATAVHVDKGRVAGVTATDVISGRSFEATAAVVVNATGAAVDRLLAPLAVATRLPLIKAMNLVTSRKAPDHALGGRALSGRNLFMVPWQARALFGTWESSRPTVADDLNVRSAEIDEFLSDLNQAFPSLDLTRSDVTLVHRGVVPAVAGAGGRLSLEGRDQVRDHVAEGIQGLISVAGTKYTTARAVAERVTDLIVAKLGRSAAACRTASVPLPLPSVAGDALLTHAAAHECVVTLEDAVVRRTTIGALGYPGDGAARSAAAIVGGVLGWHDDRVARELLALKRFYELA